MGTSFRGSDVDLPVGKMLFVSFASLVLVTVTGLYLALKE